MENRIILLVDDDPVINFIHKTIFSNVFPLNQIITLENGLLAMEYIRENPGLSFLVFLDINMPVMNGWEFLETLKTEESRNELTIFILTSSIDIQDLERSNREKLVTSYLTKPLGREDLLKIRANL